MEKRKLEGKEYDMRQDGLVCVKSDKWNNWVKRVRRWLGLPSERIYGTAQRVMNFALILVLAVILNVFLKFMNFIKHSFLSNKG